MKELIRKLAPISLLNAYYEAWAWFGAVLYRHPSHKIKVIGITGTNGKTSVTHITCDLLEMCGHKVASISSIRFKIGKKEWDNPFHMTMLGRFRIQKFLRDAVDAGCDIIVMEVTSEGILQKRHKHIKMDTVAFTNLTPEHIERHGSYEAYREAKGELFQEPHRVAVVNADDAEADYFADLTKERTILFSKNKEYVRDMRETIHTKSYEASLKGIEFEVDGNRFRNTMLGEFSIANSLAALAICIGQREELQTLARFFPKVRHIPGRTEIVAQNPLVMVDFAHTPDGFEKLYEALEPLKKPNTKVISVFGSAGGGRDKWKRPALGEIADKHSDIIILANEDPYDEDPIQILEDVQKGIKSQKSQIVLDRRKAIRTAIKLARKQDIVVVLGKGTEPMIKGAKGQEIKWDDRKVSLQEWKKLKT